jgi:serine/threonine protein kinase
VRVDDGDNAPGGHACQSPSELKELAMPMLMEMLHASSTKDDGSAVVQLKAAALPMRVSPAHYTHRNFEPSMCVTLLNHGKFSGLALKMLSESVIGPGKEDSAAHMLSVSWALSYRSDQHKHVIMPPPHEVSVSRQDVLSEVAKLSSYSAVVLDAFWPTHNSVVYLSVLPRYPLCDLKTLLRYPWELLPPELIYIDPVTKRQTIRPVDRCNIAGGLLVAVQCLHGCKVLHNDIKPENCLLWYDKALDIIKVSLCDFDSAIVINSSLPGSPYKGTTCRY